MSRRAVLCCAALALAMISTATAQYSFDPSNADEQIPGMRYFGSAKDANGVLLPGVTFILDTGPAIYTFVTDEMGRFRGKLPLDTVPEKISPRCAKAGFKVLRVVQRRGTLGPRPTVQVDCILQAEHAR